MPSTISDEQWEAIRAMIRRNPEVLRTAIETYIPQNKVDAFILRAEEVPERADQIVRIVNREAGKAGSRAVLDAAVIQSVEAPDPQPEK